MNELHAFIMMMTGYRIIERTLKIGAMNREIGSFHTIAIFLGVTSPNISTRRVSAPVTYPRKLLPQIFMVKLVTKAERPMLTRLLQISTVAMKMLDFS